MQFIQYKQMDMIFFCESSNDIFLVLPDSLGQIACDSCIQGPVAFARQDVDSWLFHIPPIPAMYVLYFADIDSMSLYWIARRA